MPIEIKQINVKLTVESRPEGNAGATTPAADKDALIRECVEQVVQVLEQQKER